MCLYRQSCSRSEKLDGFPAQSPGPGPKHQKGAPSHLPLTAASRSSFPLGPASPTRIARLPKLFCQGTCRNNFLDPLQKQSSRMVSLPNQKHHCEYFPEALIRPLLKFPGYYLIRNLKLVSVRYIFSLFVHQGQKIVVWHKCPVLFTNLVFYR